MSTPGRGLRVLVLNWQDRENPQAGGAEEHLHEVFGRLTAWGHEVTLLVSGFKGAEIRTLTSEGMEVHRTGSRHTFSVFAPLYFREHLRARDFDVVVEDLNKVPLFAPLWCGRPVVALVHHLFGATVFREANPVLATATWLLERPIPWIFKGVRTVAVSDSTRQDLIARGLRAPITVIHNGIDTDLYHPSASTPKTEKPTVLYLGRLKRYKGIDLLMRAVARLVESGLDIELHIAGAGDALASLWALKDELGIAQRVQFHGFVDTESKIALLRQSWLHVLSSPKEGWGITNLEAAACGTPSVASDSPGLRESVLHAKTGLLVPHGDEQALAAAISRLVADGAERGRMGVRARDFAETFSWERSSKAMETILFEAAGAAGG